MGRTGVVESRRLLDGRVAQRHVPQALSLPKGSASANSTAARRLPGARVSGFSARMRTRLSRARFFPRNMLRGKRRPMRCRPMRCRSCASVWRRCRCTVRVTGGRALRQAQGLELVETAGSSCELRGQLGRDAFWRVHLPPRRKGARWDLVRQTLVLDRFIDPGSEWRLHRHWFDHSAVADLLGCDFTLAAQHRPYECHDFLLEHERAL